MTHEAPKSGVERAAINVTGADGDSGLDSRQDEPGYIDIFVREDKMAAMILELAPPRGRGEAVTIEEVERRLAKLGVVFGVDLEKIYKTVTEVAATGIAQRNIIIAQGQPPEHGQAGKLELLIGREVIGSDTRVGSLVKPGQAIALKIPATSGRPGKNVLGGEVPPQAGADIELSAGENVSLDKDGIHFISKVYGVARKTWKEIAVTNLVRVSPDGMWAEMPLYPFLADNHPFRFEDIIAVLKNEGVKYGLKETLIKAALEAGEPVENLRVAEAAPAQDGVDAKIEFRFTLNRDDPEKVDRARQQGSLDPALVTKELVSAGDVLAVKIPMIPPVDGRTITGAVLKGAKPKDKQPLRGEKVTVLEDGLTYAVSDGVIAGYADYANGCLSVEDPLRISEDGLWAYLSIHPPSDKNRTLTMEQVKTMASGVGIVYGLDLDAVAGAIKEAAGRKMPLPNVVLARGDDPENGCEAIIDFKFQTQRLAGAIIQGVDRIDYRERSSIQNVKKGDILVIKKPPTLGRNGVDVFGKVIPAAPGKNIKLTPAGNVIVSPDGLIMTAAIDGMVTLKDQNRISVSQVHEIQGDVDLKTGNLVMDGALNVRGWIRSGFIVRASGEIYVGGGIEDALVQSRADILVAGGILGSERGKIKAGGDLSACFVENAWITVDGDLIIRDDIRNSRVSIGGRMAMVGEKGRIIGGTIEAAGGVLANEIGTTMGVKTRVSIEYDPKLKRLMVKTCERLEYYNRQRAKMDTVLVRYTPKIKNKTLSRDTLFRLSNLVKLRRKAVLIETKLKKYKEQLSKELTETDNGTRTVTVNRIVYAGAVISISGVSFEVKEDILGQVKFVLNQKQDGLELVR